MTLDDDLILLQIELLRYDAHLQKEVAKRLGITHKELLELLSERNIDGRNINAVNQKAQETIKNGFDDAAAYLAEELNSAMPVIAAALSATYRLHLGHKFNEPKTHDLPNISGATIGDWLAKQASNSQFAANRFATELMDGKSQAEIAEEVDALLKRNKAQAKALASTARSAATNEVNLQMMLKSRRVKLLQQKSHLDTHTTMICRQRHNKRWEKPTLKPVGHQLVFKNPPLHFNCRSIIKPLLTDEVTPEDNYDINDWLDNMPENVQDKALGKGKAALWRKARADGRNTFTINDLLDQSGRELTLNELGRRYDPYFIPPRVDTKTVSGVKFTKSHLARKIKHNVDFDGDGTSQKLGNLLSYQSSIINHLNDEKTIQKGYYSKGNGGDVYYNRETNIAVVIGSKNHFLTSIKLVPGSNQYNLYMETGKLV